MKKRLNIYFILFCFFLLMNTPVANSQDFIDEDYLDNIGNNAKPMLTEKLPAFSVNEVPDKWKNESAVVIAYKRSILFDKKSSGGFFMARASNVFFFEKVRFKIKVLDRNAVNGFTEVYFRYGDKEDGFSASLIKPDGRVEVVDLKDAVDVESKEDVPEFFKSFFDRNYSLERRYYKVGIPNMEPGDVLEYVATTKSKLDVTGAGSVEFPAQYEICSKGYPILYNEINIETDDKSYFKSLSGNGAPEFKKEPSEEKGFYRYVFIDKDRGTEKDANFINELQVYPFMKFQVVYANNAKVKGALIGAEGELKKGFTKEELGKKAWEDYENTGMNYYGGSSVSMLVEGIWMQLKKLNANEGTDAAYIDKSYYFIRNIVAKSDGYLGDKTFAYVFRGLLEKRSISSELIISISNSVGKLDDILFDDEIRYVVKVKDKFYFNCTDHSKPEDLVESLQGCQAYIIGKPAKKTPQEIKPIQLPFTDAKQNNITYSIKALLDTTKTNLIISRESTYNGLCRTNQINQVMRYTTFILDDYQNYGGESPTSKMNNRQLEEYDKSIAAFKENVKKSKPEYVKEQLQKEYGQKITFRDFKIISDGRAAKSKTLSYTESFELPGKIRQAGKKLLVNLAGLTASQLQLKKDERKNRKYDITISYPRTITWNIQFKIPDGYTADGLKELNTMVDNEAGSFSSVATVENTNIIRLVLTKTYKQRNLSKEKWNDMLAFVDAAYNNMFKYILLIPKN
jgi:hypothetical protein